MAKSVAVGKLQAGDVVKTERGTFVLMAAPSWNRRGATQFQGAYEHHLKKMLANPTDTKKMVFYTVTPRRDFIDVVGKVPTSTVEKMKEMNKLLHDELHQTHSKNLDALDLKWNKDATVKSGYRRWKGAYDVVTQKGEHVSAGDLVMVKFSNGNFEMVMGNENGHTYDGSTGRFYCRSPWKVGKTGQLKAKIDRRTGQIVYKESKPKARSMPPESLLYLIKKKEPGGQDY